MEPVLLLGYEGRSLEALLALLRERRVELVVDVRERAASRKPGFAGPELQAALAGAGIAYEHRPELGCTRELREFLRGGGDRGEYAARYAALLAARPGAVEGLVGLVRGRRAALLCTERRLEACHRQVLAGELARAGLAVEHA